MAKNKKTEVPHYELLYIVPNKYTEDDLEGIAKNVKKLITDNGGKITLSEVWGKKKFQFPIKHAMFGYYLLEEFDVEAKKIEKISTELRMSNEVLRHMIVNRPEKTPEQLDAEKRLFESRMDKATKKTDAKPSAKKEEDKKKPAKKVDTKELDDKLSKILETDDLL